MGSLPFDSFAVALDHVIEAYPRSPFLPEAADQPDLLHSPFPDDFPLFAGEGGLRIGVPGQEIWSHLLDPKRGDGRFGAALDRARQLGDAIRSGRAPTVGWKLQLAGPATLLAAIRDPNGVPLLGDPRARSACRRHIARLAERMIRALPKGAVAEFWLDEPLLGLIRGEREREAALAQTSWVLARIREIGPRAGVHCCSEPPWELAESKALDVLSFDASMSLETPDVLLPRLAALATSGGTAVLGLFSPLGGVPADVAAAAVSFLARRLSEMHPAPDPRHALRLSPACGTLLAPPEREREIATALRDLALVLDRESKA